VGFFICDFPALSKAFQQKSLLQMIGHTNLSDLCH